MRTALGIEEKSPQQGEDLARIARQFTETPNKKTNNQDINLYNQTSKKMLHNKALHYISMLLFRK